MMPFSYIITKPFSHIINTNFLILSNIKVSVILSNTSALRLNVNILKVYDKNLLKNEVVLLKI